MSQPVIETPGVFSTFTRPCNVCGAAVQVTDSQAEPHRCRIELN